MKYYVLGSSMPVTYGPPQSLYSHKENYSKCFIVLPIKVRYVLACEHNHMKLTPSEKSIVYTILLSIQLCYNTVHETIVNKFNIFYLS